MFCWFFYLKTSQSSREKLCSQIRLAKELGCLLTLTFSEGATFKCTSSAISRGILEWACFVQNSSSASDSIELVSSLIPLPAVSGCRFPQDSGYLAGNIFWSTCCGSRPWHSWGRKLQHTLLSVSVTFTTWRIGFPFLLYPQRQPFSLWSLCKYSAVILAWKPPRCNHFDLGTSSFTRLPSFPGIASALQHIFQLNATKYKTCEEQAASKTRRVVHLLSFVSQGACLRSSRDWIPYLLINFKASISVEHHLSCTLQRSKSPPTSLCSAAFCIRATCGETIQAARRPWSHGEVRSPESLKHWKMKKCGSRILFSCKKYLWFWYVETSQTMFSF